MELSEEFRERLGQVYDVRAAIALLQWDQEVYMPIKGAEARGRQIATLSGMGHRLFTDEVMGEMLRSLKNGGGSVDVKLVEETWRDYELATRLPDTFVEEFAIAQSAAYEAWTKARAESDFGVFLPHLERMVDLLRRKAELLGYEGSPYDALLDEYERGMTTEQLDAIFGELAEKQSALVERIVASPNQPDVAWVDDVWDVDEQWKFTEEVLRDMGYDFEAGRQDRSVHPFTTNFDVYDVRVTTRLHPRELFSALTGSIHEGGHALYEQGFLPEDRRTTLAEAPSLGMHESQSRLWENIIGRSLPFWRHYIGPLRGHFPGQLDEVAVEDVYRAINAVQPSFIRVEADECTYNLHVILRYEIERALIEGTLAPAEVPDVWNEKVKAYLGLDVPDDAQGCLQDIHWSHGSMGYFPTYALGNLYSAQLFEKILEDLPELWQEVEAGRFQSLLEWLRENIHRVGRRKTAAEIVQDVTGRPPEAGPYLKYLENKYTALYAI